MFEYRSLWETTAEPFVNLPALEERLRVDIAVVGAGFTGLVAALTIAEAGRQVVLVEAKQPGYGASGRNGGQVIPGLKYDPDELERRFGRDLVRFAGGTADRVFELIAKHEIKCAATRSGWIQGATSRPGLETAKRRCEQWSKHGAPVEFVGASEARNLIGTDQYLGAFVDRRGGHVQPLSYARGLARAARKAGARLFGDSPVVSLGRDGATWRVSTEKGTIVADRVILATAGYANGLWPVLESSTVTANSFQVATRPLGPDERAGMIPADHAVSETRNMVFYYRFHGDRLVMGGWGTFADPRHADDVDHLRRMVVRLFPRLAQVDFDHVWFGRFVSTVDHLPHFHELAPGLTTWIGCNGRGIALATAFGRELARHAMGDAPGGLPLPFTTPKSIPFHRLQPFYVAGMTAWYRLEDALVEWRKS